MIHRVCLSKRQTFFYFCCNILFAMVIGLLGCQQPAPEIQISFQAPQIVSGEKFRLKTALQSKKNERIDAKADEFAYTASLGKIEGDVYQAPDNPGEETITIKHLPTSVTREIKFAVAAKPVLVIDLAQPVRVACGEQLTITPKIKIGTSVQATEINEFSYASQVGTFNNNVYQAPNKECRDVIHIAHPALKLKASNVIEVTFKPILVAKMADKVLVGEKLPVNIYLQKGSKQVPIDEQDLEVSAVTGSYRNKSYHAPTSGGVDTLTIVHKPTQQTAKLKVTIEDLRLELTVAKSTLNYNEKLPLKPEVFRKGQRIDSPAKAFEFSAKRGKFVDNVYQAPRKEGKDIITITHIPSKIAKSITITIKYSPYQIVANKRFQVSLPSEWIVEQEGISFVATATEDSKYGNCEVRATVLPGFDFLDASTMKLFFQQQTDSLREDIEESSEDEIILAQTPALRVTFDNYSSSGQKAWWIFCKRDGAAYILSIRGKHSLFSGKKSIPQHILDTFAFKKVQIDDVGNLKITSKRQSVSRPYFKMEIPQSWQIHNLTGGFLKGISKSHQGMAAVSKVNVKGRSMIIFILAHHQYEVQSFDLSIILVLFRQMVKDATMELQEERDLNLPHGLAKLLELKGGKVIKQKTWLVATKHHSTAFGILIRGPVDIWDENPELANELLQKFTPKDNQ